MPSITIFEAWQQGLITEEQYFTLLSNGAFPNTIWTPGALDQPATTSVMTVVESFELEGTKKQSVVVKNTGPANSLKVLIQFYVDEMVVFDVADTIEPNSDPYWVDMEYAFTKVDVSVQDAVAGDHTTYEIRVAAA